MIALSGSDRTRLVAILGMLSSTHDGERASAALLATRMVRERNLTWGDLIGEPAETPRQHEERATGWRSDLALAQRHVSFCSAWEQGFIGSLARRRTVSAKQQCVLTEIATALRERGKA